MYDSETCNEHSIQHLLPAGFQTHFGYAAAEGTCSQKPAVAEGHSMSLSLSNLGGVKRG